MPVQALIVHFDYDDPPKPFEDRIQSTRQRMEMPKMQSGVAFAPRVGSVDSFLGRAIGRTPSNQQYFSLRVTMFFRPPQFVGKLLVLLPTFRRHSCMQTR